MTINNLNMSSNMEKQIVIDKNENGISRRKMLFGAVGVIGALALIFCGIALLLYDSLPSTQTQHYLILAVEWPLSVCLLRTNKTAPKVTDVCDLTADEKWIIHGLWPSKEGEFLPKSLISFNECNASSTLEEMMKCWPNKMNSWDYKSFWEHQWLTYGRIYPLQTNAINSPSDYFKRTFELYQKYDVNEALAKCNIHPDDSKFYNSADFLDCFQKHFNVHTQLSCKNIYSKKSKNIVILKEVRFCFTFSEDFIIQNCTGYQIEEDSTCQEDFKYPLSENITSSAQE
ncbi:ribonuclease T2-like [Planococcus citri]|uniref:ribonuclease T2-like n=1 Tax=Planococcus citri TaxID=170843 RepID=UPI0031F7ADC8